MVSAWAGGYQLHQTDRRSARQCNAKRPANSWPVSRSSPLDCLEVCIRNWEKMRRTSDSRSSDGNPPVILLTSIPFVLICFLFVRFVVPLSFKDVLHLSLYSIGAGIFAGATSSPRGVFYLKWQMSHQQFCVSRKLHKRPGCIRVGPRSAKTVGKPRSTPSGVSAVLRPNLPAYAVHPAQ